MTSDHAPSPTPGEAEEAFRVLSSYVVGTNVGRKYSVCSACGSRVDGSDTDKIPHRPDCLLLTLRAALSREPDADWWPKARCTITGIESFIGLYAQSAPSDTLHFYRLRLIELRSTLAALSRGTGQWSKSVPESRFVWVTDWHAGSKAWNQPSYVSAQYAREMLRHVTGGLSQYVLMFMPADEPPSLPAPPSPLAQEKS